LNKPCGGPHVGFYGGINYGSVHVTDVYEKNVTIINDNHGSFVGGTGRCRCT